MLDVLYVFASMVKGSFEDKRVALLQKIQMHTQILCAGTYADRQTEIEMMNGWKKRQISKPMHLFNAQGLRTPVQNFK